MLSATSLFARNGHVSLPGPPKRVVIVADAVVDTACIRQYPNLVRIPDLIVEAVTYWPFAAWPQAMLPCDGEPLFLRYFLDFEGRRRRCAKPLATGKARNPETQRPSPARVL